MYVNVLNYYRNSGKEKDQTKEEEMRWSCDDEPATSCEELLKIGYTRNGTATLKWLIACPQISINTKKKIKLKWPGVDIYNLKFFFYFGFNSQGETSWISSFYLQKIPLTEIYWVSGGI